MTRPERDDERDTREPATPRDTDERDSMDLALTVYVEGLARGQAVLFVGEPDAPAALRLRELAASFEALPRGARRRPSRSGIGSLRTRSGVERWGLIWLSDAGALLEDEPLLDEVRGALDPRGAALFVFGQEASYEGSHAALRARFPEVRMIGQAPFAGQSLVDFAAVVDDPSLSFDGTLADDGGGRPLRFVALVGAAASPLEPHAIIQLPKADAVSVAELRRDRDAARARLEHSERRLQEAQREIARTSQKLDQLRHELASTREQAQDASASRREQDERARRDASPSELAAAKAATQELEREVRALEASLHERGKEIVALEAEVARRGTLVRDLLEERAAAVATPTLPAEPPSDAPLRDALVGAQRRAVDAEASRAAALFARDEAEARAESARAAAESARQASERACAELRSRAEEAERELARARAPRADEPPPEAAKLEEARAELSALREAVATREAALTRAHEDLEALGARLERAEAGLRDARREGDRLAELEARSHVADAELASARAEGEALRAKLGEAQAALAEASERADEAQRAADERSRDALLERDERLLAHATTIATLGGEVAGLRWLAADLEAARRAASGAAQAAASDVELASLRERLGRLGASHDASLELQRMTAARADAEAARSLDLAQRVLALDALVARVQSALAGERERALSAQRGLRAAEQRVGEANEARAALEALEAVRAEAERAASEASAARISSLERALEASREAASLLGAAARESHGVLAEAVTRIGGAASIHAAPAAATDPFAREQLEELRGALEDREVLLRSLTAQLEDKDDRLRALEATMRAGAPSVSEATEGTELRASVAERDERIARLRSELEEARAAYARLETRSLGAREHEIELRRLENAIADRDAQLMTSEGRAVLAEQALDEARRTFAASRKELEQMLAAGGDPSEPPALAEHLSELLRLLRRL